MDGVKSDGGGHQSIFGVGGNLTATGEEEARGVWVELNPVLAFVKKISCGEKTVSVLSITAR